MVSNVVKFTFSQWKPAVIILTYLTKDRKKLFLNELSQFLADKGRYICRNPNLAGRAIDLHDLYNKITAAGGYRKVTDRGYWEDFLEYYGFPSYSVTLAYGLQKIYQLYLEDYERVHFFGDDEPQPFSRSYLGVYRRFRHPITESQRIQLNMNMDKASVSDYDRVVLSLESCLPNEIDFAVNACTLLSGESRHVLRLPQCRRIVDALLLHAGIVSDGLDSYQEVLTELQNKTKHNYRKFWSNSVAKKTVLTTLLPLREDENSSQNTDIAPSVNTVSEIEISEEKGSNGEDFVDALQKRLMNVEENTSEDFHNSDIRICVKKRSKWSQLFHGHRSLGVEDYEGQRVLQIALVLLNLSFEDFNVTLLAQHISLIRFVFLCIHSEYSCLRQTGLDILSNISSRMQLIHLQYDMVMMMFDSINSAVLSDDKFERIRGFEILGNICRPRPNIDHVCVYVNEEVYESAVQNLMVQDVELLLSSIEALYRLSKLGETACTKIIFIKGCIDILVCLVTLNVRTFGADKLAEIRLARRITSSQQQQPQQQAIQPVYQIPGTQPVLQQQIQRQIIYQQQSKLGSVHQAQPMVAAAAPKITASVTISAPVQIKSPIPSQPAVNPTPTPQLQVNSPPPTKAPQPSQPVVVSPQSKEPPKPIMSPPPTATTPPVVKSSPPGAGPTYTHSETGTVPPVFHYMPAPPTDIVQDNSPESFTKLWIWATYEFDAESYIPRVDVYCEYLASSNRYGRQGKTEVLSATDFGKCLKQIFPNAASRLFNQGRGQPQYHIAGIKKRATPLPVPGYQLKDPSSVFSSEYEKIPTTKSPSSISVSANNQQTTTVSSSVPVQNATDPPVVAPVLPTAVPIQQLQFQPVLIVSQVPGTNNVALVQGMQCQTVNTGQLMVAQTLDGQAVALTGQSVIQSTVAPNVQNAVSSEIVTSNGETVTPAAQDVTSAVPTGLCASSVAPTVQCVLSMASTGQCVSSVAPTAQCVTPVASIGEFVTSTEQKNVCETPPISTETSTPTSQTGISKCTQNSALTNSKLDTSCNKIVTSSCNSCGDKPVTSNEVAEQSTGMVLVLQETGTLGDNNHSSTNEVIAQDEQLLNNNSSNLSLPNPDVISSDEKQNHIQEDFKQKNEKVPKDEIIPQSETDKCLKDEANGKAVSVLEDNTIVEGKSVPIMNGYPEPMEAEDTRATTSVKSKSLDQELQSTPMDIDMKSQKFIKSSEEEPMVNGFCEEKKTVVNGDSGHSPLEGDNKINSSHPHEEGRKEGSTVENFSETGKISSSNNTNTGSVDKTLSAKIPVPLPQTNSEESEITLSTQISNSLQESNPVLENAELVTKSHSENEQKNVENVSSEVAPQTPIHCVAMTPITQTLNSGSELTDPVTPKNPIPHSALNQRLKETITRRKNSQSIIATPSNTNTTPVNVNLPAPSIIQQYSYKAPGDGSSLVQQIIPITPQQLQQQYHQQRLPNINISSATPYQGTPSQIGMKRSLPQVTGVLGGPPVKVLRPTLNTPIYTPTPSSATPPNHVHYQQQPHSSQVQVVTTPRHALPFNSIPPRPPRPQVPQQHQMPPRPNTPVPNPHQVAQQKPKPPTIDLMAPNASLLVLYRNVGKIPFANHLDEKEDAISKSIRLTASLILTNIARHSHLGRGLIQKHEEQLANVAMSQMDCSPIVAKLLSEIDV